MANSASSWVSGYTLYMTATGGDGDKPHYYRVWHGSNLVYSWANTAAESTSYAITPGFSGTLHVQIGLYHWTVWPAGDYDYDYYHAYHNIDYLAPYYTFFQPSLDYFGKITGGFHSVGDNGIAGWSRMEACLTDSADNVIAGTTQTSYATPSSSSPAYFTWNNRAAGTYKIKYIGYDNYGNQATTLTNTVVVPSKPGNVTNLKRSSITPTSVTLTWDTLSNIDYYLFTVYNPNGTVYASEVALSKTTTSRTLTLPRDSSFYVMIRGENLGSAGNNVRLDFDTYKSPTAPPTINAETNQTSYGLTANWSQGTAGDGALSYNMIKLVKTSDGSIVKDWTNVGLASSYTFSGLALNTAYTLQMIVYDVNNIPSVTSSRQVSTLNDTTPPPLPSFIKGSYLDPTFVTLSWDETPSQAIDPGGSGFSNYYITVDAIKGAPLSLQIPQPPAFTSMAVGGLTVGDTYKLTIVSEDRSGNRNPAPQVAYYVHSNKLLKRHASVRYDASKRTINRMDKRTYPVA